MGYLIEAYKENASLISVYWGSHPVSTMLCNSQQPYFVISGTVCQEGGWRQCAILPCVLIHRSVCVWGRSTDVKDEFLHRGLWIRLHGPCPSHWPVPAVWSPLLPTSGANAEKEAHECDLKYCSHLCFFDGSFMKNALLQFGSVMKIFRFRDRQAGGALYSGR